MQYRHYEEYKPVDYNKFLELLEKRIYVADEAIWEMRVLGEELDRTIDSTSWDVLLVKSDDIGRDIVHAANRQVQAYMKETNMDVASVAAPIHFGNYKVCIYHEQTLVMSYPIHVDYYVTLGWKTNTNELEYPNTVNMYMSGDTY